MLSVAITICIVIDFGLVVVVVGIVVEVFHGQWVKPVAHTAVQELLRR